MPPTITRNAAWIFRSLYALCSYSVSDSDLLLLSTIKIPKLMNMTSTIRAAWLVGLMLWSET